MKRIIYIVLFVFALFFVSFDVQAQNLTLRAKILDDGTNVRSGAGTQNSRLGYVQKYSYYTLVENKTYEDTNNHKGCTKDWYQIYYNGVSAGYVCGDHVEVVTSYSNDGVAPQTTCEVEMANLGFPSSYWGGLCSLKEKYSNWQFTPIVTNLKWKDVVEGESACGLNYIYKDGKNDGFIDTSCTSTSPGGYVAVNQKGVAYYMDPRNYLSERFIFQFQHLGYDSNLANSYANGVSGILVNASFYQYHLNRGVNFSNLITNVGASSDINISPIFISARILQELGSTDSLYNLYSGVYTGHNNVYYGYYNFYNFGVSDSCVAQNGTTYCGLNYAHKMGWNSIDTAIKGGVSQIANNYVSKGQYTGYLQKFNIVPTSSNLMYNHQYMSNVAAPSSESATTYKSYNSLGILNSSFNFRIPVFLEMDATIVNSNSGAVEDNSNNVVSALPISTIVTSSGYRYTSNYVSNIGPGTDLATLKSNIESVAGGGTVSIQDQNGNNVSSGIVATGYKIVINNKQSVETLELVVKGDTSGDGAINALDLLQVQKSILGTYNLSGSYNAAADTSGDGAVNALDLLQVQKNILGTYTIVQ